MNRDPSLIILEALLQGHRIKIDDYTYVLSENYTLCIVAQTTSGEVSIGEKYLAVDDTLGQFIRMCKKLTSDKLRDISSDIALNKIRWNT